MLFPLQGRKIYCNKCAIRISRQLARQGSAASSSNPGNTAPRRNASSPLAIHGACAGVLSSSRRARNSGKERFIERAAALEQCDDDNDSFSDEHNSLFTTDTCSPPAKAPRTASARQATTANHTIAEHQHQTATVPSKDTYQEAHQLFKTAGEFPDVDDHPADAAFNAICSRLDSCEHTTTVNATNASFSLASSEDGIGSNSEHFVQVKPVHGIASDEPVPRVAPPGLKASSSGVWSNGNDHV